MHKLKKMLALLLAVSAISGGVSIPVNAEELLSAETTSTNTRSYHQCDINRDGVVNDTDYMVLMYYLKGMRYESNYNLLDANRNQIVDWADVTYVLNYLLGVNEQQRFISRDYNSITNTVTESYVTFPSFSGFASDNQAGSTTARSYTKYTINSSGYKTSVSTYTLTPSTTPVSTNSNSNPDGIVDGSDTRYTTTLPENSGIVKIQCGNAVGTGFIVNNHVIATAAHVVNGVGNSNKISVQTHNSDGTLSSTTLTPIEVHIPSSYSTSVSMYDYALVLVSEDLTSYPKFQVGSSYNLTATNFSSVPIYVTGNPATVYEGTPYEIDNSSDWKLYSEKGNIANTTSSDTMVRYNTDTSGGDSGSPVYTITKITVGNNSSYVYTALAVHDGVSSQNLGARFTKYHQQFYNQNFDSSLYGETE